MPIEIHHLRASLLTTNGCEMHARLMTNDLELCLRGDFNFTWSYGVEDIDETIEFLLHMKNLLQTRKQKEA